MQQHVDMAALLDGRIPVGDETTVAGWVRTRRDSKAGFSFLNVYDGSCLQPLQVLVPAELPNYEALQKVGPGCSVRVTGTVMASAGKGQSTELHATGVEVVGWVESPDTYPIQPKRHTMEFLREVAHLRPRTNLFTAVARVRNAAAQSIHRFLDGEGFHWIHTPIITASDTEGAGELFRVTTLDLMNLPRTDAGAIDYREDFFAREAFLTVSGQLNVEAYCLALSKVYTFGPTFRAENSNTKRHLAEFWMVEPEIAFADLSDDADLAESLLRHVFTDMLDRCGPELDFFSKFVANDARSRLEAFLAEPFARMDYTEAIRALESAHVAFEFPVSWGMDLASEHERWLCETHVGRPVVVMNYPREIKAFYMRLNDDERTVAAMDVLAPGIGEIIGGSQREERLEVLDARMREAGLNPEDYGWYRDLRRYGSVPHAGFGLGFERLISYITGVENVRDVIPFPRTPRNAAF